MVKLRAPKRLCGAHEGAGMTRRSERSEILTVPAHPDDDNPSQMMTGHTDSLTLWPFPAAAAAPMPLAPGPL